MKTLQYWIDHLELQQHPEGGYYRETYRSGETIPSDALPSRFSGARNFSTSIYFLLPSTGLSLFHRIRSDEIWYYHAGASLTIYVLDQRGLTEHRLGSNPEQGESFQVVIPAECWFGALVNTSNSYTLSSCSVAPGFDFADFEIADRTILLNEFPFAKQVIERLTNP